jgi:hypothetical protein
MLSVAFCLIAVYFVGFLLGKKYEKDKILDGVYGVLSTIDKTDLSVSSVTYYYNKEDYDQKIAELKKDGEDYYE